MKSSRLFLGVICIICLAACRKEKPLSPIPDSLAGFKELFNPAYQISADSIRQLIHACLEKNKQTTVWDSALVSHYQEEGDFLWLNDSLVSDKPTVQAADSMLYWLENILRHGINPRLYPVDSIRNGLQQIRTLQLQDGKTMNSLLADLEYQLTAAYLSYVCRLKFGFLPPERRWNDSIDRISLKRCDMEFALSALDSLRANPTAAFHWAQPSSRLYKKMHSTRLSPSRRKSSCRPRPPTTRDALFVCEQARRRSSSTERDASGGAASDSIRTAPTLRSTRSRRPRSSPPCA